MQKSTLILALAPAVASLLLGACASTPVTWAKMDGTGADVTADLRECRHLAANESWRMSWERRWPPYFYDPRFMPPYYAWMRPFWFDFPMSLEREQALVDFCMHSKGYRLERLAHGRTVPARTQAVDDN